jgi:hypothetical protein
MSDLLEVSLAANVIVTDERSRLSISSLRIAASVPILEARIHDVRSLRSVSLGFIPFRESGN